MKVVGLSSVSLQGERERSASSSQRQARRYRDIRSCFGNMAELDRPVGGRQAGEQAAELRNLALISHLHDRGRLQDNRSLRLLVHNRRRLRVGLRKSLEKRGRLDDGLELGVDNGGVDGLGVGVKLGLGLCEAVQVSWLDPRRIGS